MPAIADDLPTQLFPITSITIPEERQREKATADAALMSSIERDGLLNPILLHADGILVAGERRLDAHVQLGRTHIKAIVLETLDSRTAFRLELQENLARKQLTWQEEAKSIARYHTETATGIGGWTQLATANDLGISQATVSRAVAIVENWDDEVAACPTSQGAFNLISGRADRARIAAASRGLDVAGAVALALPPILPAGATKEERTKALLATVDLTKSANETVSDLDASIENIKAGRLAAAALAVQAEREVTGELVVTADALDWAAEYAGPKFDVIHTDFPYGKGYSGSNTRKTGKAHINPTYADDPDIYFGLVDGMLNLADNFAFPVAHWMCWFDMEYYQWTVDRFRTSGWNLVQPYPLMWAKGYTGVAADVKRRPRHCYETALLFTRGDRKISKLTNDHIDFPLENDKLHMSQKPVGMLKHFLALIVDEHTALLDPTCGSGSALTAARQLSAARVLGVELDPANADVARFLMARKAVEEKGVENAATS